MGACLDVNSSDGGNGTPKERVPSVTQNGDQSTINTFSSPSSADSTTGFINKDKFDCAEIGKLKIGKGISSKNMVSMQAQYRKFIWWTALVRK